MVSRTPVEHFERLARDSEDPWDYETSGYEQDKYRRTLDFLPESTGRTLEIGCSIGVFTEMLVPRCDLLVAVDFSPTALERARNRMAEEPSVTFQSRTLPEETPTGPFDTIICSEVLYYWSAELVRVGLRKMEAALAPGGTLIAIHWRGSDPRRSLIGDDVHHILRRETNLRREDGEVTDDYLIDRWSDR